MMRVATLVSIAFLVAACTGGAATPTSPKETLPPPTATLEPTPTATLRPTPTDTLEPTYVPTSTPKATPDQSLLPRTWSLLNEVQDWDAFYSPEGLEQFLEAFSIDIADYLDDNVDSTLPLAEQAQALDQLQAALPGFEGGKVVPAEVDGLPPEELFVVPNMMAGPLLLFRHEETGYMAHPILAKWAAFDEPVASMGNMWPHSAQAIDATGDGHPEALVVHTFSGASNARDLVQILRWRDDGFEVLFQAELVDWAGPSDWALVPYGTGRDIELTYPVFLPGRNPKASVNPEGRQRWRWNGTVGRYILVGEAVGMPPVGLTAFLDSHPEAVSLEREALKEALADFDITVLDVSPADLDGDGVQEIVVITEGGWQQASVAWKGVGGWQATGLAAAEAVILEEITPPDDEGRRGVVLTLEGYPSPNMKTFLWNGFLGLPISAEVDPSIIEWPVWGW